MARAQWIPRGLESGPFTLQQARQAGLTADQLRGPGWQRIAPRTYVRATLAAQPLQRLAGALVDLPANAVFTGRTAAWLHGLDQAPCDPIELNL